MHKSLQNSKDNLKIAEFKNSQLIEENERMKSALIAAEFRLEELQDELSSKRQHNDIYEKKDREIKELEAKLNIYKGKLTEYENSLDNISEERKQYFQFRKQSVSKQQKLEEEISELKEALLGCEDEINDLREKNYRYEKKLNSAEEDFKDMNIHLEDMENEND